MKNGQVEIRAVLLAQLRVNPVMLDEQLGSYFRQWDFDSETPGTQVDI